MIHFKCFVGSFGLFRIDGNKLGRDRLLVVHEGDWIRHEAMCCHQNVPVQARLGAMLKGSAVPKKITRYSEVQEYLGKNLKCVKAEWSEALHSTMFLYERENGKALSDEYILAVPANGEEIYFQIYSMDSRHALTLQVDMDL